MLLASPVPVPDPAPVPNPAPVPVPDVAPPAPPAPLPPVPDAGWEWPQFIVDTSQVLGAGLGVVAIVVSAIAIYRAETLAARERRVAHELEVLRGMIGRNFDADDGGPGLEAVAAVAAGLVMLRDCSEFPLTRAAFGPAGGATQDGMRRYHERYPDAPPLSHNVQPLARFRRVLDDGTFSAEWNTSLERRLEQQGLAHGLLRRVRRRGR